MTGRKRSGLAIHRRAYKYEPVAQSPTYTLTYNGNTNTGGNVPTDHYSPYTSGLSVTVLGNSGSLVKTGFIFNSWFLVEDWLEI